MLRRTHRGENWFSLKCTLDIQSQNSFNKINKFYSRRLFPGQINSVKSMGSGLQNPLPSSDVFELQPTIRGTLIIFWWRGGTLWRTKLQNTSHGLPWWRSGWESACQCREHRFEPWSGRIPHAAEQLGPWATTTEPVRLEPVLRNKRGRDSERPTHRDEEWPLLTTTRESPRTETKTQHSQKKPKTTTTTTKSHTSHF